LASGKVGTGRLADEDDILDLLASVFGHGSLAGRRVVVTAGPTRERIDPVRYLSNRSSGAMGFALATAARRRGADVVLVAGPVALPTPPGVARRDVESAAEMRRAVLEYAAEADAIVMTAAVADFRPAAPRTTKWKKSGEDVQLDLVPNPDILAELGASFAGAARRPVLVGFAAETDDLVANARAKRGAKDVDLIVGNPVPASFGSGPVDAVLVDAAGESWLRDVEKAAVAAAVLDRVEVLLDRRSH
jgi:phosphopantothenoylcysteine decarboxylase/phosphopantothenate--cysteine ligase